MMLQIRRLSLGPERRRNALSWFVAIILVATTLPLALYWAKDWLWPEWFHRNRTPFIAGGWLALLGLSLLPLRERGAGHLIWAVYVLQWVILFRSGSWTLGLLGAFCCAWLLSARKFWRLLVAVVLSCAAVFTAGYERLYGPVSPEAMAAVLQTNTQEASGFVFQHLSIVVLSMLGVMLLTQITVYLLQPGLAPIRFSSVLPFVVVLMLFGSAGQLDRLQAARTSLDHLRAQSRMLSRIPPGKVERTPHDPLDVVLILGESNTRWHWQLYGYPGLTNPRLASLLDQLIVFRDVVSEDSHTVPSLTAMFYRPYYDTDRSPQLQQMRKVSVLDALHVSAVETTWLSAQAPYGPWSAPVSQLARDSTNAQFFNHGSDGRLSPQSLIGDPDLLARDAVIRALRQPANSSDRLIVQHMQAPHFPYCKYGAASGYAPGVAQGPAFFGEAADLTGDTACYDRALRFTDEIISSVINATNSQSRPTVVVFVPDHGEAPEEGTGHNNSVHSARHVEVPLLVHFNQAARRTIGNEYAGLKVNAAKPMMNTWVGELLLDLFHVSVEGMRREVGSTLVPSFTAPPRILFRDSLPLQYDVLTYGDRKDALELTRLNMQQIAREDSWKKPLFAHRVDSQAKALEAKQYFSGIEMDLMFNEKQRTFDIYHPPAAATGLTLDMQLQAIADKPDLALWFDFKNPPMHDSTAVLQILEALNARWKLKSRTVLEMPDTAAAQMRAYSNAGWRVSYYIPGSFGACNDKQNAPECNVQAKEIVETALRAHATYLSFDYESFPAVSTYIVPRKQHLQLLSWTWVDSTASELSSTLANYPRLDGLIIPFKSKFSY